MKETKVHDPFTREKKRKKERKKERKNVKSDKSI